MEKSAHTFSRRPTLVLGTYMTNIKLLLLAPMLLGGCATNPSSNLAYVGVISTQPPFQLAESEKRDSAFVESTRNLELQYGVALAHRAEELLADVALPHGARCDFSVTFIPGGEVVDADLTACQLQPALREHVRTALIGQVMPYSGFESVFLRIAHLAVCAPRDLCSP